MRLWGWWRKDEPETQSPEVIQQQQPATQPATQLLEDLPPKYQDDVETAAKVRAASRPGVVETIRKLDANDFRNIASIPCFRNAMLTGLGIGSVTGLTIFAARRSVSKAVNWTFGGFFMGSVISWEQCRFRVRQGKRNISSARQMYSKRDQKQDQSGQPGQPDAGADASTKS